MTAEPKNVYFDVLNDIVNKYNSTYHNTTEMKPINNPKFKIGNHVRISKCKNNFTKRYAPNWSEEDFEIGGIKNTAPWTYVINDLIGEKIVDTFDKKELQKTNEKGFRTEKIIKRKRNKLCVKWKVYDNSSKFGLIKKTLYKMSQYLPKP